MKTAIIVGCKGQDGTLLGEYLSALTYRIIGIDRNYLNDSLSKNNEIVDIEKKEAIEKLIQSTQPDEVYYFATYHHSSEDSIINDVTLFEKSNVINVVGLLYFLEAIKKHSQQTKIFYTSSSLIFGATETDIQTEETPQCPDTIYGITKITAQNLCTYYRNQHNIFASVGIMYNHESHLRTENFLTKKIIKTALAIKNKTASELIIGDLNATVDWGYAPDYVEAMHKILQLHHADDFIIATGIQHSVTDFVKKTFDELSLDYTDFVRENKTILSRKKKKLLGDSSKLRKATGWYPKTSFDEMIKTMIAKEQTILAKNN